MNLEIHPEISQNILNWYPFQKDQKILQISESSDKLTELFRNRCSEVRVESLDTIKENEIEQKYDFIILVGISKNAKLAETIKKLETYLRPEGKLLVAVDNKFGLRFFAGNPENILNRKFESLIGYNNEKEKIETYTKTTLENIFRQLNYNTRFYYPLPDYRMPNVIFSDDQLPEYNSIDKYNPYYTEKSDILFNEIDVFREILKTDKNMFTFFANSFLIEATKRECNREYKYISFNNLRKEEYRLITKISDDYVEKQVVNEKSNNHYQGIKDNIKILQENGIELVDYLDGEKIKSKYIEQKYLLNNVLTEMLEQGKNEEFDNILDKYIKTINIDTYKETDYEKTIFGRYKIEIENKEIIENLNFMKNGLWDMTFKNCFYLDNKFLFFDQEWNEPNLPVEFILYRAILYTISLRRFIQIDKLFEKYELTQYLELFEKLDNKLQEKIRDDETWKFYSQNHNFDIDATKQEIKNLNIRSEAQNAANENLRKLNNELQEQINSQQNKINIQQQELNNTFFYNLRNKFKRKK